MSDLGGRPLTFIAPATIAHVLALDHGVIVARRSRCGRFLTYQAATKLDPSVCAEVARRTAVVVADEEDVRLYSTIHGPMAGEKLRIQAERVLDGRL